MTFNRNFSKKVSIQASLFVSLPFLFFLALLISSCQKEISPLTSRIDSTQNPATTGDTSRWILSHIKFTPYDTITGQIDPVYAYEDSLQYNRANREMIIIKDGVTTEKFSYTADSLLSSITYWVSGNWEPYFKFNRTANNTLQSMEYDYGSTIGTGYYKTANTPTGKKIQYIDTINNNSNSEAEFYTVNLNTAGQVVSKIYEKDNNGMYYSDWTDPRGEHYFSYDGNGNLTSVRMIQDTYNQNLYKDTFTVTYTRDIRGNNVLWNYFRSLYGKDLAHWLSKYKFFYENLLSNETHAIGPSGISSYYNYGVPCTKMQINKVIYYPVPPSNSLFRYTESQTFLFNNVYDSRGNLTSYTSTINGKTSEKWEFRYSKL